MHWISLDALPSKPSRTGPKSVRTGARTSSCCETLLLAAAWRASYLGDGGQAAKTGGGTMMLRRNLLLVGAAAIALIGVGRLILAPAAQAEQATVLPSPAVGQPAAQAGRPPRAAPARRER